MRVTAIAAALLAGLAASIPFIAAGHVGILGVGLVNDDMASHLLLADWIAERFHPEPVLVDQGYLLGPHALVMGSAPARRTHDRRVRGLVLAIPALTAFIAAGVLDNLRPLAAGRRVGPGRAAVPRRRLPCAGGVQGADRRPHAARLAVLLPGSRDWRGAIALGDDRRRLRLCLLVPWPRVVGGNSP